MGRGWGRGWDPIIFNNIECHIKGKTCAALHNYVVYEIRSGTKRHIGMHDFYQFNYWNLNLRECEEGGRAEPPHSGGIFFSFLAWMVFVKAIIDAGKKLRMWLMSLLPQARGWRYPRLECKEGSFGSGWSLQTNCRFSLTSVVSSFLSAENSPLMRIQLILKGLKVN